MHRTLYAAFLGGALLVSFAARPVSAQVLYGSAVGIVQDPTGGVVAEAPVTLTRAAKLQRHGKKGPRTVLQGPPLALRLVVAEVIIETLESLDLHYPKVDSSKLKELDRVRDVLLAEAV